MLLRRILPALLLLPGCATPQRLTPDLDPWSVPAVTSHDGVEFLSEFDPKTQPPSFALVGVRIARGEEVRLARVEFHLLGPDGTGGRVPLGPFLSGDACGGRYLLFGWWPIRTEARPLWIRGRAELVGGGEIVVDWQAVSASG